MNESIDPVGTELLLDRTGVPTKIQRDLGEHVNYLKTLTDWGVQFLKRSTVGRQEKMVPAVMLFPVLYRQVLSFLDVIHLNLSNGAVYASKPSLRALYEATLSIEWILEKGKERWGYQFYVGELRQRRSWTAILVAGTPEHEKVSKVASEEMALALQNDEKQAAAKKELERIDQHLEDNPRFKAVNQRFKEFKTQNGLDYEPAWYRPGGPSSIADMAGKLGRSEEHKILYRQWSEVTHGSRTRGHIHIPERGEAVLEPIRTLEGLDAVFSLAISFGERSTRLLLQEFVPAEWPRFARKVKEEWWEQRDMPNIEVNQEVIDAF